MAAQLRSTRVLVRCTTLLPTGRSTRRPPAPNLPPRGIYDEIVMSYADTHPLQRTPWARYRHSLWLLTTRDLKVRYSTSALGYVWSVLDPLVMAGIYWFVFTQVFQRAGRHRAVHRVPALGAAAVDVVQRRGLRLHARVPEGREARAVDDDPPHHLGEPHRALEGHRVPAARSRCSRSSRSCSARTVGLGAACCSRSRSLLQAILTVGRRSHRRPARRVLPRPRARGEAHPAVPVLRVAHHLRGVEPAARACTCWAAFNPLSGIFGLYRAGFFPDELDWFNVAIARA